MENYTPDEIAQMVTSSAIGNAKREAMEANDKYIMQLQEQIIGLFAVTKAQTKVIKNLELRVSALEDNEASR